MKKLSVTTGLFLAFALISATQKPSGTIVTVDIGGLGNDSVLVVVSPYGKENFNRNDVYTYDIVAQDGKFVLDTLPEVPVAVRIDLRRYNMEPGEDYSDYFGDILLMVNPGDKMKIAGELKEKYVQCRIEGSPDNDARAQMYVASVPYMIKIDSIRKSMSLYYDRERLQERDSAILKYRLELDEVFIQKAAPYIAFIENNLDSDVAAMMMEEIPQMEFLRLFPMLSERIRRGSLGTQLQPYYDRIAVSLAMRDKQGKIADGETVPDFTLKTLSGDDFTLSACGKEYTLIDFWSDGCSPCLEEMPVIKRYYEKYGDRIDFISIGCLITEGTWRNTIGNYDMVWTQAMDDPDDRVQLKYNVIDFPSKYLIDNNQRKVIAYQGQGDEFWQRIDELMK